MVNERAQDPTMYKGLTFLQAGQIQAQQNQSFSYLMVEKRDRNSPNYTLCQVVIHHGMITDIYIFCL